MEAKAYLIPYGSRIKVQDGDILEAGDELTEGSVNPHDILKIKGIRAVQDYMIQEVQRVYRLQGVEINDKHIEVICRQMLKKVRIETNGDTSFLPGTLVDILEYNDENDRLQAEGLELADGRQVMLGITKASLATNSFLSAASFQETTKVLTEAAIKGKVDPLIGLKENVIIGKLIPAGTGMKRYRSVKLDTDTPEEFMLSEDFEGDGGYMEDFNNFEYPEEGFGEEGYFEEEFEEDGIYEPEDGIAEIVYDEDKYAKEEDTLGREDAIPGVDDAHVGYGENSHNDGDWTETEFNLKGIVEDDYSDGL
jgi:DNA-directed RNA polymerase subunit beta'